MRLLYATAALPVQVHGAIGFCAAYAIDAQKKDKSHTNKPYRSCLRKYSVRSNVGSSTPATGPARSTVKPRPR